MAASLARFNAPARIPEGQTVTVLRTGGGRFLATKTFVGRPDGSVHPVPYNAGKYFTAELVPVSSADGLFGLITKLEQDPHAFIVGGRPKAGRRGRVRRTLGEHGDLEDALRRAIEADVDGLPLPKGMSAVSDPEWAVRRALSLMGELLADADCLWQLSASAGMPGNEGACPAVVLAGQADGRRESEGGPEGGEREARRRPAEAGNRLASGGPEPYPLRRGAEVRLHERPRPGQVRRDQGRRGAEGFAPSEGIHPRSRSYRHQGCPDRPGRRARRGQRDELGDAHRKGQGKVLVSQAPQGQ